MNGKEFHDLLEDISVGIFRAAADDRGSFLYVNQPLARMFGYETAGELQALSLCDLYAVDRDGRRFMDIVLEKGSLKEAELRLKKKDGSAVWTSCSARKVNSPEEGRPWIEGLIENITDRKQMQEIVFENEQRLNAILQGSPVPTFVIGKNHRVLYWNKALERLVGIKEEEVLGTDRHWQIFSDAPTPCMVDLLVSCVPKKEMHHHSQHRYTRSALAGEVYEATEFFPALGEKGKWLRFTATALKDARGEIFSAMETFEDITEHKDIEKALQESEKKYIELSITDDLNRLFNARHFFHELGAEIRRSKRYHRLLSLIILDIDNFKNFNDTYGHLEGDQVLRRLGKVIGDLIRKTDAAFRYGGEEFAIMLPETAGEEAVSVAERVRETFAEETFQIGNRAAHVTVSIGVSQLRPGDVLTDLIRKADDSMYSAKRRGKNTVCFLEPVALAEPEAAILHPAKGKPGSRASHKSY
jgi:diguanylate cyclase (GGDEF)-like protein/PAS domain S-box-containing protein